MQSVRNRVTGAAKFAGVALCTGLNYMESQPSEKVFSISRDHSGSPRGVSIGVVVEKARTTSSDGSMDCC